MPANRYRGPADDARQHARERRAYSISLVSSSPQNPQEKIRNSGMLLPNFGIEMTNFICRSQRGHASIGLSLVQQFAIEYGLPPVITIMESSDVTLHLHPERVENDAVPRNQGPS
jgi:hypothetical protein